MKNRNNQAIGMLRLFLTLAVVMHHSVLAYCVFGHFDRQHYLLSTAPIVDSERWRGFDLLVLWNDTYFMALMFFISGLGTAVVGCHWQSASNGLSVCVGRCGLWRSQAYIWRYFQPKERKSQVGDGLNWGLVQPALGFVLAAHGFSCWPTIFNTDCPRARDAARRLRLEI
ncbi:hypothetical protein ACLRDC_13195 [Gluconacetobacter sacchari]|uniref:hypothetical protein n=1 Tax=Gluconacetobacter sacchari TaxID=92759 RepID=UPI0039B40B12